MLRDRRLRYVLMGGLTSALYLGLFTAGWWLLPVPYVLTTAAAHLLSALLVYPLYRTHVFASDVAWRVGFPRFYSVWLGGLAASVVGLPLLVEAGNLPVVPAQVLIVLAVPVVAYLAHQSWTFRDPHRAG